MISLAKRLTSLCSRSCHFKKPAAETECLCFKKAIIKTRIKAMPWSNNEVHAFLNCVSDERAQRELHGVN